MAKKKTVKTIKAKAWVEFSRFIRLRDSNEFGMARCCTCKQLKHWKSLQAGHFIAGRNNSILFYEKGCHAQCARCNYNEGNGPEYFIFMEETYGREEIDYQRQLKHQILKREYDDYEEIYLEYKQKAKELEDALQAVF